MLQIKMIIQYSLRKLNELINEEIKNLSDEGAEVLDVHFFTRNLDASGNESLIACIKYKISEE